MSDVERMKAALLEILSSEDDLTEERGAAAELDRVKKVARREIDRIAITDERC